MKTLYLAEDNAIMSLTAASQLSHRTRQALYLAIFKGRLKAKKVEGRWKLTIKDLRDYEESRYSRAHSRRDGELLYDKKKGLYSITQVSQTLNISYNKVYYSIMSGKLPAQRKGASYVIHKDDVAAWKKEYLSKEKSAPIPIGANIAFVNQAMMAFYLSSLAAAHLSLQLPAVDLVYDIRKLLTDASILACKIIEGDVVTKAEIDELIASSNAIIHGGEYDAVQE